MRRIRRTSGGRAVGAAMTLAGLVVGTYLWRMHREMVSRLVREMEEQRAT